MSAPRAFISFDFDNDKNAKDLFVGQARNSRTPFEIEDWSSKEHLPQYEWEALIEDKICKCNLLIVLVGPRTYLAKGVITEIEFANRNDIPVFGVYVNGAGTATINPAGLQYSRTITWEWRSIADWIDICLREWLLNQLLQ